MSDKLIEKIDELETKIAFQEEQLSKLEQISTAQQQQLLNLESKMSLVIKQLSDGNQNQQTGEEGPPPHY